MDRIAKRIHTVLLVFIAGTLIMRSTDTAAADDFQTAEAAVFAGGCFWCMQPPFDSLDGVLSTTVGYTGGSLENPTYEQVIKGTSGHLEAIEVRYDPEKINYSRLLETFWRNIDPTDGGGQFCDRGPQYQSAVFYRGSKQKEMAAQSKEELLRIGGLQAPIATKILPASEFYQAEDYHQNYYRKNPVRYKNYRYNCGRDRRLKELWGEVLNK